MDEYRSRGNNRGQEEVGNTSFSLSKDSQGRQLTENQKEYFKNSKLASLLDSFFIIPLISH
ncbi:MAG: hypothetical protein IKZ96_00680 [Bacilli bacterium]|nr:hypothetical protein [Bacilli bacterium]